jgi:hypothetical protein
VEIGPIGQSIVYGNFPGPAPAAQPLSDEVHLHPEKVNRARSSQRLPVHKLRGDENIGGRPGLAENTAEENAGRLQERDGKVVIDGDHARRPLLEEIKAGERRGGGP